MDNTTNIAEARVQHAMLGNRYRHSFSHDLSVITLPKAPDNVLRQFEHSHPQYGFFLPLTPIPFLMDGGLLYFGEVGMVYPIPSGHRHGVKYDITDISYMELVVDKAYYETLLAEKGLAPTDCPAPFAATEALNTYLTLFERTFADGMRENAQKLFHLTALICHELIESSLHPEPLDTRVIPCYQRGIRSAAAFMDANYDRPIQLSEVAEMCGFSRNYFTASFRRMYGDTPLCYLTRLRILKAKQLLRTTACSVSEIALQCGFEKSNTFTQAFKTMTGMTPSAFRNALA